MKGESYATAINAIGPTMIEDMSVALSQIRNDFKGMVLAGGPKFFSIGLDLPNLLQLNRGDMTAFMDGFNQIVLDLYTLPMPTVCAVAGHATAGGTVLALTGEYRYVAAGRKFMGLNEIKIGVPVPFLSDAMLRQIVGDRAATEILFLGEFVLPETADQIGLVDAVCPLEELETRAIEKVNTLVALPQRALAVIKTNRVEAIRSKYEVLRKTDVEDFIDCWFSPATQKLLHEAAQKF